jgi:glutaredoxin-like protein NrdH
MIASGAVLLLIATICWWLARTGALPEVVIILGQVLGAIGVALLAIGLIVHFATPASLSKGFTMTVVVYSKPGCPPCDATCRQLEKCGIGFEKIDVTSEPAAAEMVKRLGYAATPVVVVGDEHWTGFRPDRIKALVA